MKAFVAGLLLITSLPAQEKARAFDVVSINATPPPPDGGLEPQRLRQDPAGIDYYSTTISSLIVRAYGIQDYQLTLPKGADTIRRWNILARSPANSTVEEIPVMLQSLLADRFGLKTHREEKEVPGYALVVVKNGPKLVETRMPETGLSISRSPLGGSRLRGRVRLSPLAKVLSTAVGRATVVDMTGLNGIYDISVDYVANQATAVDSPPSGPTMLEAVEEALGLKLEPRRLKLDMLIVDHLEPKPTEN